MKEGLWAATTVASVLLHAATMAALPREAPPSAKPEPTFEVVEMPVTQEPEPPKPDPAPEEPELTDDAAPKPDPVPVSRPRPSNAPVRKGSHTAAQAGQALTSKGDDGEDTADFTLSTGDADTYAGGITTSDGKADKPVDALGDPNGSPSASGTAPPPPPPPPAPDRSRSARPASRAWSCSHLFPAAANEANVHHALVTVVVKVSAGGAPTGVTVVSDPGHGFGGAARACAMGQSYKPALNKRGKPIGGQTAPFSVRFMR